MFGLGKKKKNDAIITNMDGEFVIDISTCEYNANFDVNQINAIIKGINMGRDISGFAYANVPAKRMEAIIDVFSESYDTISTEDMWKISHAKISDNMAKSCMRCLYSPAKFNPLNYLSNYSQYTDEDFSLLAGAAQFNRNMCARLQEMDRNEYRTRAMNFIAYEKGIMRSSERMIDEIENYYIKLR